MNTFTEIETIGEDIVDFFHKVPQEAQDVLSASNKFLNTIKVLSTSATGQTIIDLGEAFFPAVTGVVTGAEAILSKLLNISSETPGQLLLQASQQAATLTGTAKVSAYTNIATAIASTANDAQGGTLTPQQIVSAVALVHDPGVMGGVAVAPAAPVTLPDGNLDLSTMPAQG